MSPMAFCPNVRFTQKHNRSGKYPSLFLAEDGNLYIVWCDNGGPPWFIEELRYSHFNGAQWSEPVALMHTYNSFFWGVGAPSLAVKDSIAYVCYKTYFGPTFHPEPGGPAPQVIVLESRHLVYGQFPLNNPGSFTYTGIDTLAITPIPIDPLVYHDSLVPLLVSPSIASDLANARHILWEGDSICMRYYTITDSFLSKQIFDNGVDFPSLSMNGDQMLLFYTARDSIRFRYGWSGTSDLSRIQTVAACASPFSSGPYLVWTKQDGVLSRLCYGAIPASGPVVPVELNYGTDRISYPQILYTPPNNNKPASLDFIWTEYSPLDSIGSVVYLNLPVDNPPPTHGLDMGTEIPVPVLIHRDGYQTLGIEDYQTFDYDSTELVYRLALHSPHIKYKIRWTYYHQDPDKIKLQFNIDDILRHNCWVSPSEKITDEAWIPQSCLDDNEIVIKVKKLAGMIAVLSGIEIYAEGVGSGGGPQGNESWINRPFTLNRICPNPALNLFYIGFTAPDERRVTIKFYDVAGRLAMKLFDGPARIGMNRIPVNANAFAAGVYFIQISAGNYNIVEKIVLLK